jgi:hypothetical protein
MACSLTTCWMTTCSEYVRGTARRSVLDVGPLYHENYLPLRLVHIWLFLAWRNWSPHIWRTRRKTFWERYDPQQFKKTTTNDPISNRGVPVSFGHGEDTSDYGLSAMKMTKEKDLCILCRTTDWDAHRCRRCSYPCKATSIFPTLLIGGLACIDWVRGFGPCGGLSYLQC